MDNNLKVTTTTTMIAIATTINQTDDIFKYIQIGLTILSVLISLSYTIYKWYKKANEDNVISGEESKTLWENIKAPLIKLGELIKSLFTKDKKDENDKGEK